LSQAFCHEIAQRRTTSGAKDEGVFPAEQILRLRLGNDRHAVAEHQHDRLGRRTRRAAGQHEQGNSDDKRRQSTTARSTTRHAPHLGLIGEWAAALNAGRRFRVKTATLMAQMIFKRGASP
jgi:hypothetical protein